VSWWCSCPSGSEFYLGNLTFAADQLTKFDTNESPFRLEGPTLLVVRQPRAVASAVALRDLPRAGSTLGSVRLLG
jgi:hypothetical protein